MIAQKKAIINLSTARADKVDDIIIEAENFDDVIETSGFKWFKFTKGLKNKVKTDKDGTHFLESEAKHSYIEILPIKRTQKKIVEGINFFKIPGKSAVIKYNVNFEVPGRYYLWVLGYASTNLDNSVHVGVDGRWKDSGTSLFWCEEKSGKWSWSSHKQGQGNSCYKNQRRRIYIDVFDAGAHTVEFSMREYGLEIDKFLLTLDKSKKMM